MFRSLPNDARAKVEAVRTDFASVARLLASPARSAVVDALMEGRPLAAGELANRAGVRPSTISEHLHELVDGGLLSVVTAGRHRYYRLAGAEVAEALEALGRICPAVPVRSLRESVASSSLRQARLCYDHLAGTLGVAMLDHMRSAGWVAGAGDADHGADFDVTAAGTRQFAGIGVDVDACRRTRRHFARACLDWTERRAHLAGALGAATATALLERGWLHQPGTGRGIAVTPDGREALRVIFAVIV
jgi:DNA-binding transcriptional ArsR family regulator